LEATFIKIKGGYEKFPSISHGSSKNYIKSAGRAL